MHPRGGHSACVFYVVIESLTAFVLWKFLWRIVKVLFRCIENDMKKKSKKKGEEKERKRRKETRRKNETLRNSEK